MVESARLDRAHAAIASLQRLTELFQHRRVRLARSVGLSEQQWRVLEEISTEHFMPSLFARARESSAAAVSKILRQLIDKGLITAAISGEDARQRDYALTPAGGETIARLREARARAIESIWLEIPNSRLEVFRQVSEELISSIETFDGADDPRAPRSKSSAQPANARHGKPTEKPI